MKAVEVTPGAVLALAGIGLAGFAAWRMYRAAGELASDAADVAGDVVTKYLNPASADNVVNRLVNETGELLTGTDGWTLGGAIYDELHYKQLPGPAGNWMGMPEPEDVSDSAAHARWLIDREGYFEASKWFTLGAMASAWAMTAGSGTPPPASSAIGRHFLKK